MLFLTYLIFRQRVRILRAGNLPFIVGIVIFLLFQQLLRRLFYLRVTLRTFPFPSPFVVPIALLVLKNVIVSLKLARGLTHVYS